jgi:alpha-amylase
VSCGNGWVCEHRQAAIENMVGFRNGVGSAGVSNWWSNGGNQIAFGRGNAGYVVINRESAALSRTFQTSLPAGTYEDLTHPGASVTVDGNGQFTGTVDAMSTLAIKVSG